MDVTSLCVLRVGSLLWQPRPSAWELTVVCKATYLLQPGEAVLAPEQEAISEQDDHWDDDPTRGLRAPNDLVPAKLRADVTLVGNAYAPGGQPVRSLTTRMLVGEIDKAIEVWCDRTFLLDGTLQEGPRFTRMRMTWERAAGGPGTMNPVGVRNDARDAYGRRALPNLQPTGIYVGSKDDFVDPVGFGPIAASWPTRAERRDMPASRGGRGLSNEPLPEAMDLVYFNSAPLDQQLDVLRENERIVLENLHPEHARLVTSLPGIHPAAVVERGRGTKWLQMQADTLWIDTDRSIATLTWRARVPLERPDEAGRVVVGMEAQARELSLPEIKGTAGAVTAKPVTVIDEDRERNLEHTVTMIELADDIQASPKGAVVPFTAAPAEAAPARAAQTPGAGLPFQRVVAPPPLPVPRPGTMKAPTPAKAMNVPPPAPAMNAPPPVPAMNVPPPAPAMNVPPPVPTMNVPPPVPAMSVPPPVPAMNLSPPAPAMSVPPLPAAVNVPPPAPAPNLAPPAFVMPAPPPPSVRGSAQAARPDSPWATGAPSTTPESSPLGRGAVGIPAGAAAAITIAPEALKDPADGRALTPLGDTVSQRPWSTRRPQLSVPAPEEAAKPVIVRELLQLVWFAPECGARIRHVPSFKKLLEVLARKPVDRTLDEPQPGKEPWEIEERREIFEVLARGDVTDGPGVQDAMHDAIRDDGKYVPPLVVLAVEIETPFDELETLKAMATTAAPLTGPGDEGLRAAVEAADKFLGRPNLASAPAAAEGLATRIRETFVQEKKSLPADSLDIQVERAMLAGRHYQKREVLGQTHLRALLRLPEEPQPVVAYLPEALAKRLPLARRFRARVLGEIHPAQDPFEKRDEAIRVSALATITTIKRAKDEGRS